MESGKEGFSLKGGYKGYRMVIVLTIVASIFIYTVGAIFTGLAYRSWDKGFNCTRVGLDGPHISSVSRSSMHGYNNVLVIVGPCFMAAGGAIITLIIFQWCFCRPALREQ